MLKKRKKFTSALLLSGASAFSAFVQNANTVCAVNKVDAKKKKGKGSQNSAAKSSNSGWLCFRTFFASYLGSFLCKSVNYLYSTLFGTSEKLRNNVPKIFLSSPEDFVSNMYDKNVEERAIKEFGLEKVSEERKNTEAKAVQNFREEFKKIPEEEKDKYRVKATIQENYETLVGIRKKIALKKIEVAKKMLPGLKAEIMNLEKAIEEMKKRLETLNSDSKGKKVGGSSGQPQTGLQAKNKKQVESDIKKREEILEDKRDELKSLEEISKISVEDFKKVPVSEQETKRYEETLYKAFEISKVEGNDCSSDKDCNLREGDYFKEVVGCSEHYFRNHPEKIKQCLRKDKDGNIIIKNLLNGREFCAGKFEQMSLGTAKEESNNKQDDGKKGSIRIIGINAPFHEAGEKLRKKVDVSFLLGKEEDKDALHVVASNFNAVELFNAWDDVEQKFITEGDSSYFDDHTQGPAEAIPGLSGTIERHCAVNMDKYPNDPSKWGQTGVGDRAVNLLDGFGIQTRNGYIYDSLDKIEEVTKRLEKGDKDLKDKFKIGYHANVQVSADGVDFNKKSVHFIYDKNKRVNQVYVAAISLTRNDLKTILIESVKKEENERIEKISTQNLMEEVKAKVKLDKKEYEILNKCEGKDCREFLKELLLSQAVYEIQSIWAYEDEKNYNKTHDNKFKNCREVLERFAQQVAKLNYETIFRAAVAKKNKKVYIPLLGCGAFKNKYEWVIDAIKENKRFIEDNGLEVVLNVASSGVNGKTFEFYKDVTQLLMNSTGRIDSKNFEVYDERKGAVVNVGEEILGAIRRRDLESKSGKNVNKSASEGFFQKFFSLFFS